MNTKTLLNYRLDIVNRLISCQDKCSQLLSEITEIENNPKLTAQMKISALNFVRTERIKITKEIDNIKKELNLLTYQIN